MQTEKQLAQRDAQRDIGAELLQSVREMKAGMGKVVAKVDITAVTRARKKARLKRTPGSPQ